MLSKKLISLIEKNISIIDDSREIPSEIIDELLQPVHKALFIESNPAPVKYAAKLLGLCDDAVRLPLVKIMEETKLNVKKEKILDVAKFISDKTPFDHAESVTGTDFPDEKEIEVTYHLGSYTDNRFSKQILALSTRATREDEPNPGNDSTKLPSLRDVFYSVEFHERECFEMLGVYFDGHPDNRRLLLPEDWADIPPMRKDFRLKGR